ncbi:MAG: methyltransferase domain-containing protein [Pseudomonadota bacterium]
MELEVLLRRINARHETVTSEVALHGITLQFLQIKDMAAFIEEMVDQAPEGRVHLPYWAKIWEASVVLADYLLGLPEFAPGSEPKRIVELGAGMGVPSLFLAAVGHDVVLTDFEPEALEFARAAALINKLDGRLQVRRLDWAHPDLNEPFDAVVGSELLYNHDDLPHLVRLLSRLRKRGALAYLAKGPAVPAYSFVADLQRSFEFTEVRRVLRSAEGAMRISILILGRERTVQQERLR